MDALSDVLRVARLSGGVFLNAEFFEPWCLAAQLAPEHCAPFLGPGSDLMMYHYVLEGRCLVKVGNQEEFEISAGELVLLPHNDLHLMGSRLDLKPVIGSEIIVPPTDGGLYGMSAGGDGAATRLICGFLGCDSIEANPVIATLPASIRLNVGDDNAAEWIRSTFQFAAAEVAARRPGSETMLAKLSELLFIDAVRRYSEGLPEGQTGWLAGLRDPYVSRALGLLHRDIARAWSVEALSREVGLSRSALADRFTNLIGEPPMRYLAHWRMQFACQELRNTTASLAQIAATVGYDSEAAFSRAFKRTFNAPPARWRRAHNAVPE